MTVAEARDGARELVQALGPHTVVVGNQDLFHWLFRIAGV